MTRFRGMRSAPVVPLPGTSLMLHDFVVVLFATAAGFTASGIVANLYRLLASKPDSRVAQAAYVAVMIVAGPVVLFGNAAKAVRARSVPHIAFWLATAVCGYWSLLLGLFVLELVLSFTGRLG